MKLFYKKLTRIPWIFLLILSIAKMRTHGNIVMESGSSCSVPEIGVLTTNNTAFFKEDACNNNTIKCAGICERLGFQNGSCTTKHPPFWDSPAVGCLCSGNNTVRLAGRETAGNYQLNNWTLYWTDCRTTRTCQVTCNEGTERILDAICLPWPKQSRICACKPEKSLPLTSMCGNTDVADELPEAKKSIFITKEDVPGYYTKTRLAIHMGIISAWEILGQIIILML